MARSWDERQTSSQEEEDHETEGHDSPRGLKRERARWMESDGSSSGEEPEEVTFEDEKEEEEEGNKTPGEIPIESVKLISTGDRLHFVKNTPTTVASCGFRGCTIHEPLEESQQEKPKRAGSLPWELTSPSGHQGRSFLQTPTTFLIIIHACSMIASANSRYMLIVQKFNMNFCMIVSRRWRMGSLRASRRL
jgi:hypothetical protein